MKQRRFFSAIFFSSLLLMWQVSTDAREMTTKWPFAFVDDFPENSASLGFDAGRRFALGVFVTLGDSPVKEVTFRNLGTGSSLVGSPLESVSKIFAEKSDKPVLFQVMPMPAFEPERHKGVWEATITDDAGNIIADRTHHLDIVGSFPFVQDVKATGDALTPSISWAIPDATLIPDRCETNFRVRLLKSLDTQLHRSEKLSLPEYTVPDGVLDDGDVADTYVRVQFTCTDRGEAEHSAPEEIRSETFVPLSTLVSAGN